MPTIEIDFQQEVNTSVQVGDEVYYILPNTNGEFDWADISNIFRVEDTSTTPPTAYPVSSVSTGEPGLITIDFPQSAGATINIPPTGAFIMFGKDNRINMSSLIGYFARVKFVNDSKERAELFVVNSEITISSK
tara:strand:+ start:303 stop:704 length:402 start_codon:yes stop_codon:yes gene_type:complete